MTSSAQESQVHPSGFYFIKKGPLLMYFGGVSNI